VEKYSIEKNLKLFFPHSIPCLYFSFYFLSINRKLFILEETKLLWGSGKKINMSFENNYFCHAYFPPSKLDPLPIFF
jgi:hypothetical protein